MPVLAITGQAAAHGARRALPAGAQSRPHVRRRRRFVQQAEAPAAGRAILSTARSASRWRERRSTALILPATCRTSLTRSRRAQHGSVLSGVGYAKPKSCPYEADLRRAAEVLNAGKKVAILVGAGALRATDEVIAVADRLRRRRRQGAARQGRAARRPALGDRLDRPARAPSPATT